MARKKLSIGVQNIKDFAQENMIYVDKTEKIYEMMQLGKHNFIVRPRRFGKSLFLDTVAAIYEGRKEQLRDTWIYDKINWETEKRPTLRIDFTSIDYDASSLEDGLMSYLSSIARKLELSIVAQTSKDLFRDMIEMLGKDMPIVILIDEYEMPVTDFVGENETKLQENIRILKKFYGTMKGSSAYIHRSYITGVSKIGKIGILSDLNMLNDLTLDERFTTLLGFTETELHYYYAEYITEAAQRHQLTEADVLQQIKHHYNGYSWDGIDENRVYNPFSIVNFFQSFQIRNYWFSTGTPTILTRGARKQQITMADLENLKTSGDLLQSANLKEFYSLALLFQAGYLTIKKAERRGMSTLYSLGFPNQEVRESFASYLLAEYVGKDWQETEYTIAFKLRNHLEDEELKDAFQIFAPVIASTGYDITKHTEGYFHTIMHVLMYSTGLTTFSELQNAEGRLDTICIAPNVIYIFEFKINSTAEAALAQIKEKNYAEQLLLQNKTLYIVGVNFVTEEKKIKQILVEKWQNEQFIRLTDTFTPKEVIIETGKNTKPKRVQKVIKVL
ncbi:MAG: AAA family ATPase [Saprospiraceae bacterium]|nr:AAA family ATPase [Saprospiraceae bacterium]